MLKRFVNGSDNRLHRLAASAIRQAAQKHHIEARGSKHPASSSLDRYLHSCKRLRHVLHTKIRVLAGEPSVAIASHISYLTWTIYTWRAGLIQLLYDEPRRGCFYGLLWANKRGSRLDSRERINCAIVEASEEFGFSK